MKCYRWMLVCSVWAVSAAAADVSDPRPLFIEGYASRVSYVAGEELALHVSTSAPRFAIEITRLGAQPQVVHTQADVAGQEAAIPENASSHGCGWPVAWKMPVPDTWSSGYYHVTFRAADGGGKFVQRNRRTAESSCFFIVRPSEPGKHTKILLQLSTNTYNAYNNWGGFSLYGYNGRANVQGHRVSFQRPPGSQFNNWEAPFTAWAEANGYTLDYCANSDLEFYPELLKSYRLVLSVGHDEYWSAPMRDHLEAFIRDGGNVAFFSGNTCCWQVRSEDNGQALVSHKQRWVMDPLFSTGDHRLLSTAWSHHLVNRPENQLTGVGFLFGGYHRSHGQFMDGPAAFTVHRPEHWLYEGTGLKAGDQFGGKDTIVGYECDGCEFTLKDGLPVPTHRDGTPEGFVILGSCPAKWHPDDALWYDRFPKDRVGAAVLGTYTGGGTVVTTGSIDWAHGLRGKDPVVERITRNVLDRLSK
ncbi:MAG TPA: N,N-dimethylformamidase beta subunit family domain-containing protein [Planctomycetaceae bacterium]|nr:N,N-dimethylformamidase beta subunit family domain-containing protein [Planctomycetaceae bacterium]